KFLILAAAFLACAYADVSELGAVGGYDYPQPAPPAPKNTYIPPPPPPPPPAPKNTYIPPPAAPAKAYIPPPPPPPPPAPKNTYIPPAPAPAPVETYIPPAPPAPAYIPPAPVQAEEPIIEEIEQPAQDGYRYKTVRRRVFRHRN
ncbi:hypothetical protein KR018_009936, partial [Drosophila ironensis]